MKTPSLLLLLLSLTTYSALAQKGKPVVKKPAAAATEATLKAAYSAGDYAKAIKIADAILAKKPDDERTLVVKAMAYGMQGNKEQVRKMADLLYPTSPDTEGNFLAILPLNFPRNIMKRDAAWYLAEGHKVAPTSPLVYMVEASIYADDSAYDKANAAAKAGARLLTDAHPLPMHAQMANLLHMSGGKEEGYTLISNLAVQHPADSAIQTTKYAMLVRDKKYPEALSAINKLITQYPYGKRLLKERAFLYEDMERHGDACNDALQLADADETYFALLRKLGCPQAFANLSPSEVKAYTYNVDYNGMKYQFIVAPTSIKMTEGARFNWHMTIRDDMQGTIAISKAALDTAHSQMNKFSAGPADLSSLTSFWVSNALYTELKHVGKTTNTAGEAGAKTFLLVADDEDAEPTITNSKGQKKALKTLHIRSDDNEEELWINDDPANPLITRMSLGWSIELTSIQ
jgi:Flp pilus assembly protein TadD